MTFELHHPSLPLARAVTSMVYHSGYRPAHQWERFLPDGGVELIVDLGDEPKHIFDESTRTPVATFRGAWVSGLRTLPITISAGNGSAMLVVSFRPHEGAAIFRLPMDALRDRVVPAGDVFGSSVDRLRERLQNARSAAEVFATAEAWLGARPTNPGRGGALAGYLTARIKRQPTLATVDDLVRSAGISHRTLVSVFRAYVGPTPKQFQRVHRFQSVVRAIENGQRVAWAGLALDCGFYDQSHLVKEFREFSGLAPTAYLQARGEYLNYLPQE